MINGSITRTEVFLNRRGLLVWTLVVIAVIVVYLGSYAYMEEMDMVALIEDYPEVLTAGLGMTPEIFGDVNLYYGGLVMLYGLLLASVYAMMLAGGLISRDSDLGVIEFIYTRPVTRSTVFFSKVFSFIVMMTFLWASAYLAGAAVGHLWVSPESFDLEAQFIVHMIGFLACLAAGGIAFACAPLINRVQGTTSMAVGLGFAFFLFNGLGVLYEQLRFLRYFSIYFYADLAGAASRQPVGGMAFVLLVIFCAGITLGAVFLNRKQFAA